MFVHVETRTRASVSVCVSVCDGWLRLSVALLGKVTVACGLVRPLVDGKTLRANVFLKNVRGMEAELLNL